MPFSSSLAPRTSSLTCGWSRFSEPGSRSDTRRQENATNGCDLLRLRRAGLTTGVTPATSGLSMTPADELIGIRTGSKDLAPRRRPT